MSFKIGDTVFYDYEKDGKRYFGKSLVFEVNFTASTMKRYGVCTGFVSVLYLKTTRLVLCEKAYNFYK